MHYVRDFGDNYDHCKKCGFTKKEKDEKDWLGRPKKKKKGFFNW